MQGEGELRELSYSIYLCNTDVSTSKRGIHLMTDGKGPLRSSVGAVWGPSALDNVEDIDLSLEVEIDKVMARREGITER